MKYTIKEFHDGKVIEITIYLGGEKVAKYILKLLGLKIDFKKTFISIHLTKF